MRNKRATSGTMKVVSASRLLSRTFSSPISAGRNQDERCFLSCWARFFCAMRVSPSFGAQLHYFKRAALQKR